MEANGGALLTSSSRHLSDCSCYLSDCPSHLSDGFDHLNNALRHLSDPSGHLGHFPNHLSHFPNHLSHFPNHLSHFPGYLSNSSGYLSYFHGHLNDSSGHLSHLPGHLSDSSGAESRRLRYFMNHDQLPESARRAFEDYPRVEPSPAFNRAVLDSLAAAQGARKLTLIGRVEELLGLKWWQFAASGMLGALLPAIVLGALLFSNRDASPTQNAPIDPMLPRTIGPLYARELWRENQDEFAPPMQPRRLAPQPKQGEELSWAVSKSPLV